MNKVLVRLILVLAILAVIFYAYSAFQGKKVKTTTTSNLPTAIPTQPRSKTHAVSIVSDVSGVYIDLKDKSFLEARLNDQKFWNINGVYTYGKPKYGTVNSLTIHFINTLPSDQGRFADIKGKNPQGKDTVINTAFFKYDHVTGNSDLYVYIDPDSFASWDETTIQQNLSWFILFSIYEVVNPPVKDTTKNKALDDRMLQFTKTISQLPDSTFVSVRK